ncbi:MAG TPA: epoxide hydrolase [Bradyrhizobium sp.]
MSVTPRASANPGSADGSQRDILVRIAHGALAGVAVTIGSDATAQPSPAPLPRVTKAVAPFRVVTSTAAISDARRRLQAARWPERQTADDWGQGVPLATIQALVAYWRTAYDWRRLERRLNAYPQFRTEIDGLGIHFLHVRSPHEQARPIILTHGWPGSVVEFLNVIGPLTDPTKHGGQPEDAFHVVIPSLPGFGFSDKPTESGWGLPRIARAWSELMRRLGYTDYLAQGGDWGAGVTTWMAKQHVEGLTAIHLNLPILFPPPVQGEPNQAEKATIAQLVAFNDKGSGYAKIQATRPQTIGYALADSPAGQAAWIYEKLGEWTDSNHEPEREISRDEMLDNISLYWLTNTAASSARLYFESFATDFSTQRLDLPVAVSIFPGEVFQPPRLWGERVYSRLFYWNEAAHGGHFAAFEQPAVFVEELRAVFRALPRGG